MGYSSRHLRGIFERGVRLSNGGRRWSVEKHDGSSSTRWGGKSWVYICYGYNVFVSNLQRRLRLRTPSVDLAVAGLFIRTAVENQRKLS